MTAAIAPWYAGLDASDPYLRALRSRIDRNPPMMSNAERGTELLAQALELVREAVLLVQPACDERERVVDDLLRVGNECGDDVGEAFFYLHPVGRAVYIALEIAPDVTRTRL